MKHYILKTGILFILFSAVPVLSSAQQKDTKGTLARLPQNMDIGDIVCRTKSNETHIRVFRKYFIEKLKDTTVLNYQISRLDTIENDVTNNSNFAFSFNTFNVQSRKNKELRLSVTDGYEKSAKIDIQNAEDIFNLIDLERLTRIYKKTKKKDVIYLVTNISYVNSGSLKIISIKDDTLKANGKIKSATVNDNYSQNRKDSLSIKYGNNNTIVDYNGEIFTKKEIQERLGIKDYPVWLPLGISQKCYDDKKWIWFTAFQATGIIGAVVSFGLAFGYSEKARKLFDPSKADEKKCLDNKKIGCYIGGGVSAALFAVLWANGCCRSADLKKNQNGLSLLPYSSPQSNGLSLVFQF